MNLLRLFIFLIESLLILLGSIMNSLSKRRNQCLYSSSTIHKMLCKVCDYKQDCDFKQEEYDKFTSEGSATQKCDRIGRPDKQIPAPDPHDTCTSSLPLITTAQREKDKEFSQLCRWKTDNGEEKLDEQRIKYQTDISNN